jgi:hypothetical protein
VTKINQTQQGQPDPQHSSYFAVKSNFESRGTGEGPREMPPALLMTLADDFVDRLFDASNDLVVDVASMGAIDPTVGGFIDDTLDFGSDRLVYRRARRARVRAVPRRAHAACRTARPVARGRRQRPPAEGTGGSS